MMLVNFSFLKGIAICLLLLLTANVMSFILKLRNRRRYLNKFSIAAGENWILGHLLEHPGRGYAGLMWVKKQADRFRTSFVINAMFDYVLLLCHPTSAKDILKTAEPKNMSGPGYQFFTPWLGNGLLISKGNRWARNRRLLGHIFHFDILKTYIGAMSNSAVDLSENFLEESSEGYFDVQPLSSRATLDVILNCAMSYKSCTDDQVISENYIKAVKQFSIMMMARFYRPHWHPDFLYRLIGPGKEFDKVVKILTSFSTHVLEGRKQKIAIEGSIQPLRHMDFLDLLLVAKDDNGEGLSDQEILDEINTFVFAGHDTTASALSWTLYYLGANPIHMKRCQEEVDSVLCTKDHIDWEDLGKFEYLTRCLKESLRCSCPVPFIMRRTTQEMEIDGRVVAADTIVEVNIYDLHHSPHVWGEDHEKFNPDHFEESNVAQREAFSYIPFSAGPRNCIGQNFAMNELKIMTAFILKRLNVEVDPDHVPLPSPELIMRGNGGIRLRFTDRST